MPNLCHGSTNRRTCIHYRTCWCDNYTTARQTDVHVFTISLLQPQARTFLTSWQLQGRKELNQHCGHFNNTGSCWSRLGRVKIENVVMSTTPVLTSPANAGQGWKELNQHSGHLTNLAQDCPYSRTPDKHTPYWHPIWCKQEWDFRKTCSLISTVAHCFQECPLFKVWWSLRDTVIFLSCKMDAQK